MILVSSDSRAAIGSSSALPGLSNKPQVMVPTAVDVKHRVYLLSYARWSVTATWTGDVEVHS